MTPHDDFAELHDLIEAFCHDELSAEQQARLEQLVTTDEALRRAYVRYVHIHICLRRAFEGASEKDRPAVSSEPALASQHTTQEKVRGSALLRSPRLFAGRRRVGMVAASVLLLAGLALSLLWLQGKPAAGDHVATLTHAAGCAWEAIEAPAVGAPLQPGRLELSAGIAEITFANGAVVLIEAPAVLELVDRSRGFLHSGRIVVRVPRQAIGFAIETQKANLVDHGTEFGVGVSGSGDTLVQVFEGVVVADLKQGSGGSSQRLTAGQTMQIDAADGSGPRALTSVAERFVRRLPDPKERGNDWLVPYNQSRFDCIHIVPAPGPIKIDGSLADWDRSGRFFIACAPPYIKDYHVEGAMMYDDKYIYVGAHVGDPAPMCSVIDPNTDPTVGWKGGAVQVRLSTDRIVGWPLDADNAIARQGQPLRAQDRSNHLVHLTMWYYRPEEKPCLHIAYGMDFHGDAINPAEFRGAFRKDTDGAGYTLEYAIPWSLLGAGENPPRSGDTLSACWNVHWSGEDGRLWRGYLIDILNPQEKGFTYMRAATWGRAIYHKDGKLAPGMVVPRY